MASYDDFPEPARSIMAKHLSWTYDVIVYEEQILYDFA